jgi:signal transduction histidine kinase
MTAVGSAFGGDFRERFRRAATSRGRLVLVGAALVFAALALSLRFTVQAPSLRATIETGLTLCGFVSVSFMWGRWNRTRRSSDLFVLVALLTLTLQDFEFLAAPAMLGSRSATFGAAAWMGARLVVAVVFAAAAYARLRNLAAQPRHPVALLAMSVICPVAIGTAALAAEDVSDWFRTAHDARVTTGQALVLTVPAICVLTGAAIEFVRHAIRERDEMIDGALGAAVILLAAAWAYDLLVPGLTANSVSGHECLRAGAYGLILVAALRTRSQQLRAETQEAAALERRRLVRDLHDGMAQDLAFIAAHGERLARDLGPEHPIAVAARRALAASRGAIVDLSASEAPTVAEALHVVADELSHRYGVRVSVEAEGEDLPADDREDVVRIAREAIVNAVQHGGATHVSVSLNTHSRVMLRIGDDGRGLGGGLSQDSHLGYGVRAMGERAEAMGGRLITREEAAGGTAVEVLVS